MVGLIVTGNGTFGSGLYNAMVSMAGEKEEVYYLDYADKEYDEYVGRLQMLADDLLTRCEDVIILVDLSGGNPFDATVSIAAENAHVGYVSSCTLGMLITLAITRDQIQDPYELLNLALNDIKYVEVSYNHEGYSIRDDANEK